MRVDCNCLQRNHRIAVGLSAAPPTTPVAAATVSCNARAGGAAAYYEFAQADYECFEALVNFAYTSQYAMEGMNYEGTGGEGSVGGGDPGIAFSRQIWITINAINC